MHRFDGRQKVCNSIEVAAPDFPDPAFGFKLSSRTNNQNVAPIWSILNDDTGGIGSSVPPGTGAIGLTAPPLPPPPAGPGYGVLPGTGA